MTATHPIRAPAAPDRRAPRCFATSHQLAHLPPTMSKYGHDEHHWRIRPKPRFPAPIPYQRIPHPRLPTCLSYAPPSLFGVSNSPSDSRFPFFVFRFSFSVFRSLPPLVSLCPAPSPCAFPPPTPHPPPH